jgi:hypothetical protein
MQSRPAADSCIAAVDVVRGRVGPVCKLSPTPGSYSIASTAQRNIYSNSTI